jgi:hypothetical protein
MQIHGSPSRKTNTSPVHKPEALELNVRPLQPLLTGSVCDSHVFVMALMHSGHAYACIATLSDALRRRQQGVEKRDARFGLAFYIHKECHRGTPACAGTLHRKVLLLLFFIPPLIFLCSPIPYLSFSLFYPRSRLVKFEERRAHKSTV